MDATNSAVEQPIDRFAGMTFGSACDLLFSEAKSTAPEHAGFQMMIDFVAEVHEAMGVEFNLDDYWNDSTISGSHAVFPANLGVSLNEIPEEITREYLDEMINKLGLLETTNVNRRRQYEQVVQETRGGPRHVFDRNRLQLNMNTAPVFVMVSDDEDDDFL